MKSDDFKLLADIVGNTNGHLKRYVLSVAYPEANESELDALERRLNRMYLELVAEANK